MLSGIEADPECKIAALDLKMHRKYSFIIYKINLSKPERIYIFHAETNQSVKVIDFVRKSIQEGTLTSPFYLLVDYEGKIKFVQYILDDDKVKEKMVYSSSAKHFMDSLATTNCSIEISDPEDFNEENLAKK